MKALKIPDIRNKMKQFRDITFKVRILKLMIIKLHEYEYMDIHSNQLYNMDICIPLRCILY